MTNQTSKERTYNKLHLCSYAVTERQQRLINRIAKYHKNCAEAEKWGEGRRRSLNEASALSNWRKENGYTQEEYNQGKKAFWQMKGIL